MVDDKIDLNIDFNLGKKEDFTSLEISLPPIVIEKLDKMSKELHCSRKEVVERLLIAGFSGPDIVEQVIAEKN